MAICKSLCSGLHLPVVDFRRCGIMPHGRAVQEGQPPNPNRSAFIVGFQFTDEEIADMLAFLNSLKDDLFLQNPVHGDPFAP